MERRLLMLGKGGHAVAVAAALDRSIDAHVHPGGEIDDEAALRLDPSRHVLVNGLGFVAGPNRRREVYELFVRNGFSFLGVRHPRSNIDSDVALAGDAQIMIGAHLVSGSSIGPNAIINTGAIVDHGTQVGAHAHVASGAILCGDVHLGEGVFIGAGAVVLPGVVVGAATVVGAGSVVRADLAPNSRVAGVPARSIVPSDDAGQRRTETEHT